MIKFLFLLLMVTVFVFANETKEYKKGLEYFQNKEYLKSYENFELAMKQDYSNSTISFYIGRSAYELGMYEDAMIAFQRVLILNSNHMRTRLELARTYMALNQPERAKEELNTARRLNPSKNVIKNIDMLLAYIEKGKQKSFWNFFLSLGVGYDSNINSNPGTDVLSNYRGLSESDLINGGGIGIISSRYLQETANVSNVYKIKENELFLESSFLVYAQEYDNYSQYNLLYLSLTSGPATVYKNYKFSLPLNYSKVYYGAQSLLDVKSIKFKIERGLNKNLLARIAAKYEKKDFTKTSYQARNSQVNELELGLDYVLDGHSFKFTYKRANEDKTNNIAQNFINRTSDTIDVSYRKALTNSLLLNAQYSCIDYAYADSISVGVKRQDKYSNALVSLTQSLTKNVSAGLEYKYSENDSNHTPMSYNKNVYSLKVNASF